MSESTSTLLDLIQGNVIRARAANAELATTEKNNAVAAEEILKTMTETQQAIGANQRLVVQTAQLGQLVAQEQAQGAVTAAGGYDAMYATISQLADRQKSLSTNLDKIRQANAANPGIAPWNAIARVVDSAEARRAAKLDVEALTQLSTSAQNINAVVSQTGQIARANARTITAASVEATASNVELEAAQQAAKWRLEGLKYNTAGVQAVAAASDKDLAYTFQLGNFARQEQQYELALREEDRRREQFNWMKEKELAARQEKIDEKGFEDRTVYYINLGEVARGVTPSSAQQIRDHIKLNKGLGADYADLYRNGEISARTGQAVVGTSPGASASIFARDPSLAETLPEQQKKIAELLKQATQVLGDKAVRTKEGLDDDKTGAKALKVVSNQVQGMVASQLRFVGNNPDNLFYIGDPSSYIGTATNPGVAAFQTYPLVQKVLNPAIAANVPLSDPTTVFNLTLAAVKRGDLSTAQAAADLSNVYRRMSALHRAGMDFRKFGITLPPDGGSYNVRLGTSGTVDATNYSAVANALVKAMVKSRFEDYRTGKVVNPGLAKELTRNTQGLPNE